MRAGLLGLVLVMGLVPAPSSAQDGLRSASLPERPLSPSLRPPREDVFRARRDTYRPGPTRNVLPVFGYFEPQFVYPYLPPIIVVQVPPAAAEPARVAPPVPAAPPTPYVAGMPGRPKTFYVIPGCYAGDRRPEPEALAPGCSISQLRVVQPS